MRSTHSSRGIRNPITRSLFACAVLGISLALGSPATHAESQTPMPAQAISKLPANAAETTDALPAQSPDVYRSPGAQQVLSPNLSDAYLRESPNDVGKPHLVVAYYNLTEGMLAGYQSVSGKRILIRAKWLPKGAVSPEVAHLNPATGQIELLMGRSKQLDPSTGRRAKVYEVAGVDILSHLVNGAFRKRASSDERDAVRQFVDGTAGRAFSEAMPALYAALEPLEDDPKLAALQATFGGILTALQLSTGVHGGFDHSDAILGTSRANSLRDSCSRNECQYRGRHFTIQNSGLFDVLSKSKAVAGKKSFQRDLTPAPRSPLQTIIDSRKNGDGNCTERGPDFGACGPGQFHPGNIYTDECLGHDMCICKWSFAACIFTVPAENCDDCDSLIDAIISYIVALLRALMDEEDT